MSQGSSSVLQESAFLSVRIVTMDHYLAPPLMDVDATFSASRSHAVRRVPVLRIFGPTPAGQKACLHLHGIFPYLYVPVPEPCPAGYGGRLAGSLERALNLAAGKGDGTQQVHRVEEVSGVPFYGYHPRQHRFFKLYLYNPLAVKRAADLLQNGAVMGARLQPHEAHVPYTLQFMMDYNLQGMNFIHLAGAKFRKASIPDEEMMEKLKEGEGDSDNTLGSGSLTQQDRWLDPTRLPPSAERRFNVEEMPEVLIMPERVERVSSTELEADAVAADILNSNEATGDDDSGMNPGLQALWEDERERRRLAGLEEEELTAPDSPPRPEAAMQTTESEVFWKERLLERLEKARSENPEMFEEEDEGRKSSDPDATCNFFVRGEEAEEGPGAKELVYPAETPESASLPPATEVHTHVSSLSATIFEEGTPAGSGERRRRRSRSGGSQSLPSLLLEEEQEEEAKEADVTIVDEEVVLSSQSQSQNSASLLQSLRFSPAERKDGEDEGDVDLFGDDEESGDGFAELLGELNTQAFSGTAQEGKADSQAGSSSSQHTNLFSQLSSRSREIEEEVEAETLEMSQAWFEADTEDEEDSDCEKSKSNSSKTTAKRQASKEEDVWGSDDDDKFWDKLILKNT